MQGINPFLWFETQAEEAMRFYLSVFEDSEALDVAPNVEGAPGPQEPVLVANFRLLNQTFRALNGGPGHSMTPAVSYMVYCPTAAEVDAIWNRLIDGGHALMPLDTYPFSERFGWLNDRYGVSWQIIQTSEPAQIVPSLLFVGDQVGRAEEAITFYTSIFDDSSVEGIQRYEAGMGETEGHVVHANFLLAGQRFGVADSSLDHQFTFSDGNSFEISCESQEEVDRYWNALTADGGEPGPCGWLKDKFGVSWQVVPVQLGQLLQDEDPERAGRAMQAMLQMQKLDIAVLEAAAAGS
jgi:predicted 3-demethylubiquinone-9 3-methyltransferase (glyoxalase superfamily)